MDAFGNMTNSELCALIDERIRGKFAERNRAILKRRLIDGILYEPLAEEFNLSTVQIKRIVYKCEEALFCDTKKEPESKESCAIELCFS